jgi:hypothetical protein
MGSSSTTRLVGILMLVAFIMIGLFLLFFGCAHWQNWWSLFIVPSLIVAIFIPALCYGYNRVEDVAFRQDAQVDEITFRNCRELGVAIAVLMLVWTFFIPILAWYNSGFAWPGVLVEFASITCFCCAYVLWLRIFVFI